MSAQRGLKILLSVFLLYHLTAVSLLPNGSSILGRNLGWVFLKYANPLLLNRTWQFFSPGPMPNMYLEYEIETEKNYDDVLREVKYWPAKNQNSWNNDFFLRSVAGMRFLAANEVNFNNYFVPFLCRQYSDAQALDIRVVIGQTPAIERSGEFVDFKDMQEKLEVQSQRFECPGAKPPPVSDETDSEDSTDDEESSQ